MWQRLKRERSRPRPTVMTELVTVNTVADARAAVTERQRAGDRVALVPTMGNLHEGHLTLVRQARQAANFVAVSIFVNPMQFGPGEDYRRYPRTLDEDRERLARDGVDLLFVPETKDVYPRSTDETTQVTVPGLGDIFCGASRPGHFAGVTTVVSILFNILQPQVAVFGQKDYQQFLIIRRMVQDLHLPVQLLIVATEREPDGLAMSSRNAYLVPKDRERAPLLYQTLCHTRDRVLAGERNLDLLVAVATRRLAGAGFRPDYFAIRRAEDLGEPTEEHQDLVLLAAAWLGRARLIDNVLISPGR